MAANAAGGMHFVLAGCAGLLGEEIMLCISTFDDSVIL